MSLKGKEAYKLAMDYEKERAGLSWPLSQAFMDGAIAEAQSNIKKGKNMASVATKVRYIIEKVRSKEALDKVDIVARLGEIETDVTLLERSKEQSHMQQEHFWEGRYRDADKRGDKNYELFQLAEKSVKRSHSFLGWSMFLNALALTAIGLLILG